MKKVFSNSTPIPIPASVPTDVSSTISVSGSSGKVRHLSVMLDIDHTYTGDLNISLRGPGGKEVLLVRGEGGSGNHFRFTTFDDASRSSIGSARPPFSGTFRPEGTLSDFAGSDPNGDWVLIVRDEYMFDGGSLNGWTLALSLESETRSNFEVRVNFIDSFTTNQRAVFEAAAQRWSEIILGDPSVTGTTVVEIDAFTITEVPGGKLAEAGPTFLRNSSGLPTAGLMRFDTADMAVLELRGDLFTTVLHEMCHVFGLGTLWPLQGLLQFLDAAEMNPVFMGRNAMREFAMLIGAPSPTPVPVANRGQQGTFGGHWRESVFGAEAMTGFINNGLFNPVSRMTIASLEDLGYAVDYDAADPFVLPNALQLAMMGLTGHDDASGRCTMCGEVNRAALH